MEIQELLFTALRTVGVYLLILIVLRSLGKRAVGNFSAFDLLVALMLGEVVDEIIYGDVTFGQGAVNQPGRSSSNCSIDGKSFDGPRATTLLARLL